MESRYTYEEVYGHSDHEQEELEYQQFAYDDKYIATNYGDYESRSASRSASASPSRSRGSSPVRTSYDNKPYEIPKKTMSYEETMKLVEYIFISNYWDKRRGNAILIDSEQISKWIKYFNNFECEMPQTKYHNSYYKKNISMNENINNIASLINKDNTIINDILLFGNGKISLCGGSLINIINHGRNTTDWDIFFHCETVEEGDRLLDGCLEMIDKYLQTRNDLYSKSYSVTQRVHTFSFNDTKIQFIKRIYQTKDQILLGFDLAPCRIGYNPIDGFFATICGGLSRAMKCFPLDTTQRSLSFGYRLYKYIDKGFSILYPGLSPKFNGHINTPDGSLQYENKNIYFRCKFGFESDYEGNEGDHLNWVYILNDKYHLITFEGTVDEIKELSDDFVRKSITNHILFNQNKSDMSSTNLRTSKFFLQDRYKEFVNAIAFEEDEKKACQIWQERCNWYVQKGLEIAKELKLNRWKTENPGSQSFGKFNPVLEHPRMWYGDNYQSVKVGLKTPQFKTLVLCLRNLPVNENIIQIPDDIINLICHFWLKAEVDFAREYLVNLC